MRFACHTHLANRPREVRDEKESGKKSGEKGGEG